jgi:hypothetical protein
MLCRGDTDVPPPKGAAALGIHDHAHAALSLEAIAEALTALAGERAFSGDFAP